MGPSVIKTDCAIRTAMHGRILRCSMGDNPTDCPLHEIRKLPVEERIAWLDSKSDDELMGLFQYHVRCLGEKQRGRVDEV